MPARRLLVGQSARQAVKEVTNVADLLGAGVVKACSRIPH